MPKEILLLSYLDIWIDEVTLSGSLWPGDVSPADDCDFEDHDFFVHQPGGHWRVFGHVRMYHKVGLQDVTAPTVVGKHGPVEEVLFVLRLVIQGNCK